MQNLSKKHLKLWFRKRNARIYGIYPVRTRNKITLYCDMAKDKTLVKIDRKYWIDEKEVKKHE